jgi:transcriptional regulator with XRE-family HTH domain
VAISPFGAYLRDARTADKKSLREVADALGITHVYLGEIERGRRRSLPEKYWGRLAEVVPSITMERLQAVAAVSEPLDPSTMQGRSREVVVALARALEDDVMSEDLANRLLDALNKAKRGQ